MKIEYTLKKITGKNKSLCVGDLVRYYGETRYKIIEGIEKLNKDKSTRGMVVKLLSKAMNTPAVELMMANLEDLAKQNIFSFTVDDFNPLVFDNGTKSCVVVIDLGDEYFSAKAIYSMMKPGLRKLSFEDHVRREKQMWTKWFEKNLKDYTNCYSKKIIKS